MEHMRDIFSILLGSPAPKRLPLMSCCPNCAYTVAMTARARSRRQVWENLVRSVTVAQCSQCGQLMCAFCCKHSLWFGYICPKCGSRKHKNIGRIKSPFDPPTFAEDREDGVLW